MTSKRPAPAAIPSVPPTDVLRQLAALKTAATADMKQQWRELFGAEPPAFSRPYLESRLAYRVQELAYGGLGPQTVARLEALGEKLDGGNITLGAFAPTIGRSRGHGWSANTGALPTRSKS